MNGHNKKILRNSGNICNKCHLGRTNKYSKVARINNNCTYHKSPCQSSKVNTRGQESKGLGGVGGGGGQSTECLKQQQQRINNQQHNDQKNLYSNTIPLPYFITVTETITPMFIRHSTPSNSKWDKKRNKKKHPPRIITGHIKNLNIHLFAGINKWIYSVSYLERHLNINKQTQSVKQKHYQ